MDKIKCNKCGAENDANAKFCSSCSAPLTADGIAKQNNKKMIAIIAPIVAVLLIAIVVLAVMLAKSNKKEDGPTTLPTTQIIVSEEATSETTTQTTTETTTVTTTEAPRGISNVKTSTYEIFTPRMVLQGVIVTFDCPNIEDYAIEYGYSEMDGSIMEHTEYLPSGVNKIYFESYDTFLEWADAIPQVNGSGDYNNSTSLFQPGDGNLDNIDYSEWESLTSGGYSLEMQ